jgi:hypothetical protein
MNICWCKVLSFADGKLGGWISENYFAYARVLDWHLLLTKFLKVSSDTPYQDPTTPFTSWTGKQCKEWLYSRNLITSGKAPELKDRVKRFMASRKVPIIIDSKTLRVDEMLSVMHFIYLTVSICLRESVDEGMIVQLEMIIRVFLSKFDDMDKILNDHEKTLPSWISSYNFLCLLNLPNILRKYGSLRYIWEGGECGEGFIRKAKQELRTGLRQNWKTWLLNNLLQNMSYDDLYRQVISDDINTNTSLSNNKIQLEYKI